MQNDFLYLLAFARPSQITNQHYLFKYATPIILLNLFYQALNEHHLLTKYFVHLSLAQMDLSQHLYFVLLFMQEFIDLFDRKPIFSIQIH